MPLRTTAMPGRAGTPPPDATTTTRRRAPAATTTTAATQPHGAPAGRPPVRLTALAAGLAVATAVFFICTPSASAAPRTGTAPALGRDGRTIPPRSDVPEMPASPRLEQQFAKYALRGSGIGWRSTGHCSERTKPTCTSFEGLRWSSLKGLLDFAEESGCEITVTGGTEDGHAGGQYSHGNGYKLDIATGGCVDRAITRYRFAGVRGDGAKLYQAPSGALFAREKDHWDILFR
ncbi:hypothetical protein AGRA3207_004228 [Actinomadura graeca]|uniref:Uncharacterized protein n=1 Tax=Actinomadura graeca TaxID=2750812 RepID=A0ABX8R087_9ACTN|nr:hypothetical protein [Actinomadura graeca]QXJ23112.1 hypothetical protein AGRA3207_004228 [Actinomadura graeca]